jgi:hypothetical protein
MASKIEGTTGEGAIEEGSTGEGTTGNSTGASEKGTRCGENIGELGISGNSRKESGSMTDA